ncbi:hypothetical protein DL768_001763 [Monosporascus sp. mg162]|nr:hypothetical protein DL768_001763 [Monosporascus sp. mg162]
MEELYRYFSSYRIRSEQETDCFFEATEIWRNQTSGPIKTLTTQSLPAWLNKDWTEHNSCNEPAFLARIAIATKDPTQPLESLPTILQIVDHFGLRLAYDYAMSCVIGVASLPPQSKSNGDVVAYTFAHPKLTAIWSAWHPLSPSPPTPNNNHPPTPPTQAIILACPTERDELKSLLSRSWDMALTSHTMFPAFLCGLIISHEVAKTQDSINKEMRPVEARTGHNNSTSQQREQPAGGSWGELSARMSGFARKLASTSRKIQVAKELQEFMLVHVNKRGSVGANEVAAELVKHHIELISKRLEMHRLQNEFLLQKVNIQLTAIFNLMAHKDSSVGLQTASSMKTLALVALVFLPGNFVAALFSAPLFDWDNANDADSDSIGLGIKPQFNLFWVITIPLTALAFILYVGWSLYQRSQSRKQGFERNLEEGGV